MLKIKKIFTLIFLGIVVSINVSAKVRSIGSQREFEHFTQQKGICVALFYDGASRDDKVLRERNKQLQDMMEDLSNTSLYDDADVLFIRINGTRKEFDPIMQRYGIQDKPCFIFFRNGQSLVNQHNEFIVLNGFISRNDLESFIGLHYGNEIKALGERKVALQNQRMKEEKQSWLPYFYPRDIFVRDYDPSQRGME